MSIATRIFGLCALALLCFLAPSPAGAVQPFFFPPPTTPPAPTATTGVITGFVVQEDTDIFFPLIMITDATTGAPVATFLGSDPFTGSYAISVPPGTYVVTALNGGGQSLSQTVTVAANQVVFAFFVFPTPGFGGGGGLDTFL